MAATSSRPPPRPRLKTDFKQSRTIDPIYTGGAVAATSDGRWLFSTLSEDVCVTDVHSGQSIARLNGDSLVTTLTAAPTPHDASDGSGVLLVARRSLALAFHPFPGTFERPAHTVARAHDAPILVSAADHTGSLFATGAADGSVKVWDAHQGHMTHVFRGHASVITALTFDVDTAAGRARLASASEDGQVRVWDLHARKAHFVFTGHHSAVPALDFTDDGEQLVSGSRDAVLLVWAVGGTVKSNVASKGATAVDPVLTIPVYEIIEAAGVVHVGEAVSKTGKGKGKATQSRSLVYAAGSKGVLRFWDLATGQSIGQATANEARSEITSVVHLKATGQLAVVHNDHNIHFYDVAALLTPSVGTSRSVIGFNDEVIDTVLLAGGEDDTETHLAVATNSSLIRVYDLDADSGFDKTQLLSGHTDVVLALARSLDGRYLLSGSKDHTARIWKRRDGTSEDWSCVGLLQGHVESVGAVAFAAGYVATASGDHTLKLWSLDGLDSSSTDITHLDALLTSKIHDKDINALDIAPHGRLLASGSQDRTARLFSVDDAGRKLTPLGTFKGHKRGIWSVRFSPVDRILATASGDRTVKLWNVGDFSCLKTFEGHTNSVLRVDFVTAGMQLVSCASDGLVKVWNVRDEACVATLDNHEEKIWALAVSKDERTIVSGGADSVITFWSDVTVETQALKAAEAEDLVLKNQDYENFLVGKDYRSAFLLGLSLHQPRRLHTLFTLLASSPDRVSTSLTGHSSVDDAIARLDPPSVISLLKMVRDWNATNRTADVAQTVLHAILKLHSPATLLSAGGGTELSELLETLTPYTERHFARADRLLAQESFALDYLLTQCDVFEEDDLLLEGPTAMEGVEEVVGR